MLSDKFQSIDQKNGMSKLFALWLILSVSTLASCQPANDHVTLDGHRFAVEIADTPHSREKGMMFREHLADDAGMLFLFDHEAPRSFWMKNCKIPLDILYFDANRRLVSVQHNVPPCRSFDGRCPSYPSEKPARYVLELNGGLTESLGIQTGAELQMFLKRGVKK